MSFPLFLMLAAIILKLGRIADRVDPEPWTTCPEPSYRTGERIWHYVAQIITFLIMATVMIGGVLLFV